MVDSILFALWFFAPAGIANAAPILAKRLPGLATWNAPVDGGRTWRGKRLLGDHKTWRGFVSGIVVGELIFWLQLTLIHHTTWFAHIASPINYDNLPILFGAVFGFGALLGDAVKSFFKRQFSMKSGRSWLIFDQLDYIVGGLLTSLIFARLELKEYAWIFLFYFGLHIIISYLAYLIKLKSDPI